MHQAGEEKAGIRVRERSRKPQQFRLAILGQATADNLTTAERIRMGYPLTQEELDDYSDVAGWRDQYDEDIVDVDPDVLDHYGLREDQFKDLIEEVTRLLPADDDLLSAAFIDLKDAITTQSEFDCANRDAMRTFLTALHKFPPGV